MNPQYNCDHQHRCCRRPSYPLKMMNIPQPFHKPWLLWFGLICKLHPDIITLDNTMPVLSGLEAAEEIFQHDKDVRIIFISALGDSKLYRAEIEENYRGDNFRILTKPIEKEDLEKILTEFPTGKQK